MDRKTSNLAWRALNLVGGTLGGGHHNWGAVLGAIHQPRITMAWNVFKFCTGLKVIGSVMIVVVLAVVGVSYYAVIIFNYAPHLIKGGSEAAIALIVVILFHVLVTHLPTPPLLSLSHTHTETDSNKCLWFS